MKDQKLAEKELYFLNPFDPVEIEVCTFICPLCKRTVSQPRISTYSVNTICNCNFPKSVTKMVLLDL